VIREAIFLAGMAMLVGCASESATQSDIQTLQTVMAVSQAALAAYEQSNKPDQTVIADITIALDTAQAAITAYAASPTASNRAAVTSSLQSVTTALAKTKPGA